jgi:hypothetical protein
MRTAVVYADCNCGSLTSTPSRVTFCWSARAPATEPYRGSVVLGFVVGMNTAPGCRLSRCTTLRPSTGNAAMVSRLIVEPTLASEVLMIGVASLTVTVSATPPRASSASVRVTEVDASATFSCW